MSNLYLSLQFVDIQIIYPTLSTTDAFCFLTYTHYCFLHNFTLSFDNLMQGEQLDNKSVNK